jgi:VWFA-related protein
VTYPATGSCRDPVSVSLDSPSRAAARPVRINPIEVCLVRMGLTLASMLLIGSLADPDVLAQARERSLFVSVLDRQGNTVPGLQPADFVVREDDATREVLRVGKATEPMQVALLVDNSQAATRAITNLRDGLGPFVNTLTAAGHEVSLVTIGDRPTIVVDSTKDGAALKQKGIDRLFAQPGSGAYLLEAISETTRGFMKRESQRPVIVAIITEGVEFSTTGYERVVEDLKKSGASFYALVLEEGPEANPNSEEVRNRNIVLDRGTRETGGRRVTLLSDMSIPDTLKRLAAELTNQYRVTYARPERLIPPERITVEVKRPGLSARGVPVKVPAESKE